ncbi:MAG: SDR family NAD(P)-dependent oxidoreductase [Gemmatimonadaceae bacterium]|nr:SDR family NAD(P)-dependent oxidoreductase [Gemmatimonadaceae bacterium]
MMARADALPTEGAAPVLVITGVGRPGQLGIAVAQHFAAAGARLVIIDRDAAVVEARGAELRATGAPVIAAALDLTDVPALIAATDALLAPYEGRVDGLIHCAGGFGATGPVAESEAEAWHRQIAINLTAAYGAARAFLPALRRTHGAAVFFASAAALPGASVRGVAAYATAKSGLLTLVRAIAAEERANGVRANALAPTAMRTAMNTSTMSDTTNYVELDEVIAVIRFLLSSDAARISGQVLELA